MNVISILVGIVALIVALVGFFPFLGWLNWLAVPIALVGLVIGQFDVRRGGRNFNIIVLIFSTVRLFLGGGIL
jgi:hypothetical protein